MRIAWIGLMALAAGRLEAQAADRAGGAPDPVPTSPLSAQWVAANPDQARDTLRAWLAGAVTGDTAVGPGLRWAQQLGRTYLDVWGDSFPLNEAQRFAAWPPERRSARVRADSLRRAGNGALQRAGLAAALRAWRASLKLGAEAGDTVVMAAALGNIGAGYYHEGWADSALTYFAVARRLAAVAGDQRTRLNALSGLAAVRKDEGHLEAAAALYRESLALRRRIGDYGGIASDANNLGLVAAALGDPALARRRHMEALVTAREHGLDEPAAAALVNLGALAAEAGREGTARRHYRDALALYHRLELPVDEALVRHNLGLLAAGDGDYRAAAAEYEAALALLQETGPVNQVVRVASDLAMVRAAMGELEAAQRQLGVAERHARQARFDASGLGRLKLARGDLAFAFNRPGPSRVAYTEALSHFRRGRDRLGEAEALSALGALRLAEEDFAGARPLLASAAARQRSLGDARTAALTELLAAHAALMAGDTAAARGQAEGATRVLRTVGDPVGEAWAQCQAGDLERMAGLPLAAEAAYRAGLARLGSRPAPGVTACLTAGLGGVLRGRRAHGEAIRVLERGIAAVEATVGRLPLPAERADFLADKWQLYLDLALAQRASGSVAAAFSTSERLRARQALDLLARGPGPAQPELLPEADPRLAILRRRITALLDMGRGAGSVIALRGEDGLAEVSNTRREAIARTQEAYAAILDSVAGRPAGTAATAAWPEVAAALGEGEALVEYLLEDSAAVAFVVTRDRVEAVELPTNRRELALSVEFLRGALAPARARAGDRAWGGPLRRLHRELIAPVEEAGLLRGVRRLVLVPHGELHYLPFAALQEGGEQGRHLVERYQLGYAPSAAVWLRLRARPLPAMSRGILALAPNVAGLPGTSAEVAAIGARFGAAATVLTGSRATRSAFQAAAPTREILHLATLGVLNKHNPLFSFVALAPTEEDDGRLEVHDVAGLRLAARLVVLSACQTALGSGRVSDVPAGDDWVGLVQAFQAAGAANVLATLWPVDDRATAALMDRFYAALRAGRPEAEALAEAQRALIAERRGRSPFEWAGFVVNGRL